MARAPRIEYEGAIYHVMSRGDRLEPIYRDEKDREVFLRTLGETCGSSGWVVHSLVLMRNHYHLLIETLRPTLVAGMQHLNSTYTRRFNARHKTYGHMFQGRYKALLVDGDESGYFLSVSDYIHLNPVRARLVSDPKAWLRGPWNSVGWLAGVRRGCPKWLQGGRVYGELGLKDGWRGRREYRRYMERRAGEAREGDPRWEKVRRGWCLGGEGFVERMKGKLEELNSKPRDRESWNDVAMQELEEQRAERMLKKGLARLGVRDGNLEGWDRLLVARWVRKHTKASVKWLAQELGMKTRGGMSNGIHLVGRRLEADRSLSTKWRKLESSI